MKVKVDRAKRIKNLPPYLFASIDKMKQEAVKKGIDIINLGIGDPDIPTPPNIVKRLQEAVKNEKYHQYPSYEGLLIFRQAVAEWYKKRFNVKLNPEDEVLTLIGSKEGIGHFPLAYINPGDVALVPSPAYPVYNAGTLFAGGQSYIMPLKKKNNFLPDIDAIPARIARKAKIMFINYPNNPTSAVAEREFYERVIEFALKYNIIIAHDAAYSEMYYDNYRPMSFLEMDGAKDVGIEFHSLSKTYNMTGWRIGFAVGNKDIISALGKVKSNLDSGVFEVVQEAGIEALTCDQSIADDIRKIYQERRDILVAGLKSLGMEVEAPKATFYIWLKTPKGFKSADYTAQLLNKAGIVTTPGNGFGKDGEGYIRMALTVKKERMLEAIERIKRL
ncbi:MAG: LL-diaminopimelate aminotransferase [Nitrospirae bacterium]|nr:LL-diaminopimelate aminotransferase [Nitrospirota bacterium]